MFFTNPESMNRIYESTNFFIRNCMFHFLEDCKVLFSVMENSYIGIFDLNRKLLPCKENKGKKKAWKKFVDS